MLFWIIHFGFSLIFLNFFLRIFYTASAKLHRFNFDRYFTRKQNFYRKFLKTGWETKLNEELKRMHCHRLHHIFRLRSMRKISATNTLKRCDCVQGKGCCTLACFSHHSSREIPQSTIYRIFTLCACPTLGFTMQFPLFSLASGNREGRKCY